MKAVCIAVLALAAFIVAEEPKETVVIAQDPKDEAVVVVEEPKEVRDMKALQQAYAFAIPYGYAAAPFGYAAAAPYGYTAVPAKFAATPFAYGANSAKFTATPYGNAYTAAPFYGYDAPYYGYTAPVTVGAAPVAFAVPAKFAAQTYPFAAAQAYPFVAAQTYPFGAAQTYPFGAAKQQQYAAYAPQYAGYQNTGFPYSYGYAPSAYSFKFRDSAKEQSASYLPENFPFAYPSYAFPGFPVAAKE
ncbi:hypothetical protein DAPPUDRAFT_328578 [Daphnia pulex]|uniref:Uncharacterized protein n=1 Tax=Daphnia pulex TaxID=6669 RepID=E9HE40_DAPPU|nr:hypothetical protein DAPPUDRAFT_328578 [Daphnia pulex]|eukprot:EFX69997.1 hypothetical protein DAPPUDRAFT_328578 [Daphnia pulex]